MAVAIEQKYISGLSTKAQHGNAMERIQQQIDNPEPTLNIVLPPAGSDSASQVSAKTSKKTKQPKKNEGKAATAAAVKKASGATRAIKKEPKK